MTSANFNKRPNLSVFAEGLPCKVNKLQSGLTSVSKLTITLNIRNTRKQNMAHSFKLAIHRTSTKTNLTFFVSIFESQTHQNERNLSSNEGKKGQLNYLIEPKTHEKDVILLSMWSSGANTHQFAHLGFKNLGIRNGSGPRYTNNSNLIRFWFDFWKLWMREKHWTLVRSLTWEFEITAAESPAQILIYIGPLKPIFHA